MTAGFKQVSIVSADDRIISWDDFKCFLALRLDGFPGRPVIETIQPLYDALKSRIESGEIRAYSRSGKMPHVGGEDVPLTDDSLELFADGTYLRFGDIMATFDELDEDARDQIVQRLADRFYAAQDQHPRMENGE